MKILKPSHYRRPNSPIKAQRFGYTTAEIEKIISVISAMMEGATLLDKPVKWTETEKAKYINKCSKKEKTYEALTYDDSGRKIDAWIYYAPINPFEFNLDCNHKIGFNTIEGMLRIYWRLTGKKYPGTEDYVGIYWLKTPIKPNTYNF